MKTTYNIYHRDDAGAPECHTDPGGPWYYQPGDYDGGDVWSTGYPTRAAAEAVASAEEAQIAGEDAARQAIEDEYYSAIDEESRVAETAYLRELADDSAPSPHHPEETTMMTTKTRYQIAYQLGGRGPTLHRSIRTAVKALAHATRPDDCQGVRIVAVEYPTDGSDPWGLERPLTVAEYDEQMSCQVR